MGPRLFSLAGGLITGGNGGLGGVITEARDRGHGRGRPGRKASESAAVAEELGAAAVRALNSVTSRSATAPSWLKLRRECR